MHGNIATDLIRIRFAPSSLFSPGLFIAHATKTTQKLESLAVVLDVYHEHRHCSSPEGYIPTSLCPSI